MGIRTYVANVAGDISKNIGAAFFAGLILVALIVGTCAAVFLAFYIAGLLGGVAAGGAWQSFHWITG